MIIDNFSDNFTYTTLTGSKRILIRLPFTMDYSNALTQCESFGGQLAEFESESDYALFQVIFVSDSINVKVIQYLLF